MHGHHDSDHYDVQFTTRQLVLMFGLLIVIVVGVFVGGIVIGRGMAPGAADAVMARRTNPVPVPTPARTPAGAVAEAPAEDALRLPIRSEPQPAAGTPERAPVRQAASPAAPTSQAPRPAASNSPVAPAAEATRPPPRTASTSPEQLSGRTLAARPQRAAAASPSPRTAAATPAPARTSDRPARPGSGKFTIQVAAFRDRGAAERMLQQLATRGIEGYLEGTPAGIFRVRVGQFESREAARAVAARLESEEFATLVTSR